MSVTWLPSAQRNLAAIHSYLSRFSEDGANRTIDGLISRGDRLAAFPYLGRVVPEFRLQQVRELIAGDYRILYLVAGEQVEVHAVFHAAIDLPGDEE